MSNELTEVGTAFPALARPRGANYVITSPMTGNEVKIERNVDFGVIPGTKKPSLYKSGAEKIIGVYQLMPRFSILSKTENYDGKSDFFMYVVECSLVKGFFDKEGHYQECVYSNGIGSANTGEKRNGYNSALNAANSTLKMAQKRAMVSAALGISGLSSMFTMDLEDEASMSKAKAVSLSDDDPITRQQQMRIFAVAGNAGLSSDECKRKLAELGFTSTKDVKQKDMERIITAFQELGE